MQKKLEKGLVLKRVLINSFHSGSLNLVAMKPKAIISFDSHMDVCWASERVLNEIFNLPFNLREAFLRAYIHYLLKKALPKVPFYLVVPYSAFKCEVDQRSKGIEDYIGQVPFEKMAQLTYGMVKDLGIELLLSPPESLKSLYEKVEKHTTVLDIDVDYMEEFQNFCYSKAPQYKDMPEERHLGKLIDIIRVVNKIQPNLIVISEAKLDQVIGNKPPMDQLIVFLKNQGYKIENAQIIDNDNNALDVLKKVETFDNEFLSKRRREILEKSSEKGKLDFGIGDNEICLALKNLGSTMQANDR